ncbi:MAG: hypothetical protein J6A01_03195 [Proteobacteria bacterium]|nr:hypothetical protein [Pseudomonadota bacterium]
MSENISTPEFVSAEEAEGILARAASMLEGDVENISQEMWQEICRDLARAARATWWRCDCGVVEPGEIEFDAICSECGQMHRLPERLSRAPWALYVPCLRHALGETWFDQLADWMSSHHLGSTGTEDNPVWFGDLVGSAYPAQPDSDAGGAAYEIAARGATSPDLKNTRCIQCIDGMKIYETGAVIGLQWIALPMM